MFLHIDYSLACFGYFFMALVTRRIFVFLLKYISLYYDYVYRNCLNAGLIDRMLNKCIVFLVIGHLFQFNYSCSNNKQYISNDSLMCIYFRKKDINKFNLLYFFY